MSFDQLHRIMMLANYVAALFGCTSILLSEPTIVNVSLTSFNIALAELMRFQRGGA